MVHQPLIPFFEVCMVGARFLIYFQDYVGRVWKYINITNDLTSQIIKDEVVDFFFMPSLGHISWALPCHTPKKHS